MTKKANHNDTTGTTKILIAMSVSQSLSRHSVAAR